MHLFQYFLASCSIGSEFSCLRPGHNHTSAHEKKGTKRNNCQALNCELHCFLLEKYVTKSNKIYEEQNHDSKEYF